MERRDRPRSRFPIARGTLPAALVLLLCAHRAEATIQFAQATASVQEGQRTIAICLTNTGNLATPAEYYAIATNGTATTCSPSTPPPGCGVYDARQTWTSVYTPWPSGQASVQLTLEIADDGVPESSETFEVVMIARSGSTFITGSPDRILITISDGGALPGATACSGAGGTPTPTPTPSPTPTPAPAGAIRLERASYLASESIGTLRVRAVRTGDLNVPQNITFTTLPGTAARPSDYNHGPFFDLPWPAGQSFLEFPITIAGDSVPENNESFTLSLSAGTLTANPSVAVITIVDDDPPAQLGKCGGDDTTLALNDDRFQFTVSWRDFQGNTGVGYAARLTEDTGYFWFFNPENVEVMVKTLNGAGINGHYWVFVGALTNVEYTLTATDTATGDTQEYHNPSGTFASFGDTTVFPAIAVADACPPFVAPAAPAGCNPFLLCVSDADRFRVSVDWRDFQSNTGTGRAVELSRDSGYFWFFNSDNVELIVKVLDGRAINGKFWVFYGALSNVEYTIRVTDTVTGAVRTYFNPSGQFGSVGDTNAF